MEFDYEQSNENIRTGKECQDCLFERVICLQENKCLLEVQKIYTEVKYNGRKQNESMD